MARLTAEEGTLEIRKLVLDKGEANARFEPTHPELANTGRHIYALVKVTPGPGYHVSTEFPSALKLAVPDGVVLSKTSFSAGRGDQGDAELFSERVIGFAVEGTIDVPGKREITGVLSVGVCKADSCHPKKLPIILHVEN